MSSSRRGVWRSISAWLPVVVGVIAVAVESTEIMGANHTSGPFRWLFQAIFGPVSDERWEFLHHLIRKTGHFIGYGVMGLAWLRAWWMTLPRLRFLQHSLLALLGTALIAGADEWHQTFLPNRTGTVWDVLLDCCGVIAMEFFVYIIMRLFTPRRLKKNCITKGDGMKVILSLLFLVCNCRAAWPSTVTLKIDAGQPVRTMQGGIGASWHAIETPIPGSNGGSGWGAYPPADDEAAWQSLYHHADWLGMDWCRVELEQRIYEPERGRFDWESPEMRILYRILDWAEARHTHIFLQQMWGNTTWNSLPELRGDPAKRVHSAPLSVDDFANGYAELIYHLVKVKGYSSIRWLSLNNEPGQDYSWWQGPDMKPLASTPDFKKVRAALDQRGITLPISGPDWGEMVPLEPARIDFDQYIGAYDIHSYRTDFDKPGKLGEYSMTTTIARISDWAAWAHQHNKPFFLSELGSMAFGWGGTNPAPGGYEASLKNASLVVRAINAGADGFNRWSFVNRGDLDGQWQLLDTWDVKSGRLLTVFTPHPNAYYMWALLSRYAALDSQVLSLHTEGGQVEGIQRLVAAALRSPKGKVTVLVVNEGMEDMSGTIAFDNLASTLKLYRYRMTPSMRDRTDIKLKPEATFAVHPGHASFEDNLPAQSITVYSTYKLGAKDMGVQAE